jgi:hypothetical protein
MKKIIALFVVVVIVVAIWFGGWIYGAGQIDDAIAGLAVGDGESAPKVTCDRHAVSGFPFRFDITCENATIVDGDVTTTIGGVKATVLAYNPTQAKFSALSPITIADAYSGAQSSIAFTGLEGSAHLTNDDLLKGLQGEGWRIQRISVVADGVDWVDTIVGEKPVLSSTHVEAHLLDVPERHDTAAHTQVLASYVSLADVTAPAYGISGGEASLETELSGLPDDLRAWGADDVMAKWRDAGGQLKVVGLKGSAGSDFVESSGTLALDSSSRLDGQMTVRSKGVVERLGDTIPPEWKNVLLGGQAPDGSYSQTMTIRAGIVLVGLLPVAIVPPLL